MVVKAPINESEERQDAAAAALFCTRDYSSLVDVDVGAAERKLSRLRRTGLFGGDLKGCTIYRACTADDLRQAYRLVHDVFCTQGFIRADPSGMRVRIFETTAETATFVAKVNGRVVGVLSVVEDSDDLGLPSDCVFRRELDELRNAGKRLCEFTNQAVAAGYRKSAVSSELMRCGFAATLAAGYHEAVAAVSPGHAGFYEVGGFRQIGDQRSYSEEVEDPVIAVSTNLDQYRTTGPTTMGATARFRRHFLADGNHFLSRVSEWAAQARREFLNPHLLKKLFVLEANFLAKCSLSELEILQQRWGDDLFAAVTADLFVPFGCTPRERLASKLWRLLNKLEWPSQFAFRRSMFLDNVTVFDDGDTRAA